MIIFCLQLIGVALLVIGVYFHFNMYSLGVDEGAPMYLIAVGAVVFIISFFGCVGAIRGNSCMLKTVNYQKQILLHASNPKLITFSCW